VWGKLHNEELHDLYSSPTIVRVIKSRIMGWAGHVALMGEGRGMYRDFMWIAEGKRPLGRSRPRRNDNIKMDLQEAGFGDMDWIELAQLAGTCECGNRPSDSLKCGECVDHIPSEEHVLCS
jgi:hypothetical protein